MRVEAHCRVACSYAHFTVPYPFVFFHNQDLAVRLYEKEAPYMARTTMLTLTGISYTYPSMSEPLFEHVSASFQQGWTAVLGDNGLGKTTLLNIAIGMLPADTGSINPDRMDSLSLPARKTTW